MPTPITMPIPEVADRFTIAKLKSERLGHEGQAFLEQVRFYQAGLDLEDPNLVKLVEDLYEINSMMWDAEHAIRKGQDDDLGLVEIGRRALRIRDLNRKRITIKNLIAAHTRSGFQDAKMNYATEA